MSTSFDIPVLLVTFNRPETAKRVFEAIRAARPRRLYLFSDSPRPGNKEDEQKVRETRAIITNVDWECEVFTKFEEANLGCGRGVSSAISWIFTDEEKAIILEDDCLPHPSFFSFCEQMLNKYADDPRVMHISGTRWNEEYDAGPEDYFFSSIGHIWGWASWKRVWDKYDYRINSWNKKQDWHFVADKMTKRIQAAFWMDCFQHIHLHNRQLNHTWDYQFQYLMFKNNGLSVVPNVNLISNIGMIGVHASTGKDTSSFNRETFDWKSTGADQQQVQANKEYDDYHVSNFFLKDARFKRKVKLYIKSFL